MDLQLHPLPTSSFINSNQPAPRPGPLTTATKKGKEAIARKGRAAPTTKKDGPVKGKKGGANAKTKKVAGANNIASEHAAP